jgi:hypothetical protein
MSSVSMESSLYRPTAGCWTRSFSASSSMDQLALTEEIGKLALDRFCLLKTHNSAPLDGYHRRSSESGIRSLVVILPILPCFAVPADPPMAR